jgi:hypothetical protein
VLLAKLHQAVAGPLQPGREGSAECRVGKDPPERGEGRSIHGAPVEQRNLGPVSTHDLDLDTRIEARQFVLGLKDALIIKERTGVALR